MKIHAFVHKLVRDIEIGGITARVWIVTRLLTPLRLKHINTYHIAIYYPLLSHLQDS